MKKCGGCKQVKPLDDFHVHRANKDGRQRYCKQCNAKYGAFIRKSMTKNMRYRNHASRGEFLRPRKLTEREIDELVAAVNRTPLQPIRLKVYQ